MTSHWVRLGEELRTARLERGMEQQQVAAAIGVKRGALSNIESGNIKKVSTTVRRYAELVGWTSDSPEQVLEGRPPTLRPAAEQAAPAEPPSDLSLHAQQALREGPLLDSQVITIRTPGGDIQATIVARGTPGSRPDDLLRSLQSWRDAKERLMRELGAESGEPTDS